MSIDTPLLDEITVLQQFSLDSMQQGIKVHGKEADIVLVCAAKRLFDKGLVTQSDGGYLTDRGIEACKHLQALMHLLAE